MTVVKSRKVNKSNSLAVKPNIRYQDRQMCRVVVNIRQGGQFRLSNMALDMLGDLEPKIKRNQWQHNLFLRSHPALIITVQQLGKLAAGRNCSLMAVMVPKGQARFRIDNSSGIERIVTPKQEKYTRVWWF